MDATNHRTRADRPALFVSEDLWIELSDEEILADLLYPVPAR